MPELAEVEFYRRRWQEAAARKRVLRVDLHSQARVFRGVDTAELSERLRGSSLLRSETSGKQMLFRFGARAWVGIHLGMSGELTVRPTRPDMGRHEHLVLRTAELDLVFGDPRMFGRVRFDVGAQPPDWWNRLSPSILSAAFSRAAVAAFLQRRARAPIKAVLLMQERFPGVGNWMADEILWRAAIHPRRAAGSLSSVEVARLWRESRAVSRQALVAIAGRGRKLPPDLNVNIPRSWLFLHRWTRGGKCPRTGAPLAHAEIGGRTTCWSPARQKLRPPA